MVVLILLLITGLTIPVVVPAIQGRHIREASRQINSYFAVARDTALRTGRPVGVMIQRFETTDDSGTTSRLSEMSVVLSQVEVPPPYSGDYPNSRALISPIEGLKGLGIPDTSVPPKITTPDLGWDGLILAGDLIQFNYQGRWYRILDINGVVPPGKPMPALPWGLQAVDGSNAIPCYSETLFSYQIVRQPVRTATPPLQLTGTVIIDLNWSGDSNYGFFVERNVNAGMMPKLTATYPPAATVTEDYQPIIVMFAPTGSLERIYRSLWKDPDGPGGPDPPVWDWINETPSGPIHLLIGQREAVPANATVDAVAQEANNWRDLESLWVSIHPQTGQITTTENAEVTDPAEQANPYSGIVTARQYAIRAQNMGGR